jgi:hypothetical protein
MFLVLVSMMLFAGCAYTDARCYITAGRDATTELTATTAKPVTVEGANNAQLGDAAIGALAGGAAGSVVPVLGTGAGAAAGAATGAIAGKP